MSEFTFLKSYKWYQIAQRTTNFYKNRNHEQQKQQKKEIKEKGAQHLTIATFFLSSQL